MSHYLDANKGNGDPEVTPNNIKEVLLRPSP